MSEGGASREEELRRLVAELQLLEGVAESLQSRINMANAAITELRLAKSTLEGLEKGGPGSQLLVPIGGGSYIMAKLQSLEKVIVGIGAGVSVERSLEDAKKGLDERVEAIRKARDSLQKRLDEVLERIRASRDRARELSSKLRGEAGGA